jgi:hypothetical protein
MQNDDTAHETAVMSDVPSMSEGEDQLDPLYFTACPELSTAMQNDDDGHDTELIKRPLSMLDAVDQA